MIYQKPKDITYTEMCMYIDDNVYKDNFDERLVYEYIYHIVYMLAKKAQYFKKNSYYDDFAIYGANRVFFRLTNKKQWELKDDDSPKMEKVKSVLNYIKNILYPLKVDFEQSEYCQSITRETNVEDVSYNFNYVLDDTLNNITFCEFGMTLNDIGKTCNKFLRSIPYKHKSVEWLNIYTSVMLTFLNMVTLTNKRKNRLQHLEGTMRITDQHINDAYDQEAQQKPILFHLDESMSDYILVLTRQLKHIVAKDLSDILHTNVSNDITLLPLSVKDYISECEDIQDEY
jgi:hypothetical protein